MAENTEEKSKEEKLEEKKAEEELPAFKDFAERKVMSGSRVSLNSILNKELIILDFEKGASKFESKGTKICTKVQFKCDGEEHIFFTGSVVLTNQLETYKDKLPFRATVQKITNYYTFS